MALKGVRKGFYPYEAVYGRSPEGLQGRTLF
jgi:hypothetical protein